MTNPTSESAKPQDAAQTANARDAARYRWLRSRKSEFFGNDYENFQMTSSMPEFLIDAHIDAAIAAIQREKT